MEMPKIPDSFLTCVLWLSVIGAVTVLAAICAAVWWLATHITFV